MASVAKPKQLPGLIEFLPDVDKDSGDEPAGLSADDWIRALLPLAH